MNKYVWLVETIQRAGEISLKEIQGRWLDSDLSEGVELSQRTFHNYFDSKEDAIMEFAVFCVDNLIDTMEMLPPGANTSVIAAVEQAVIMHLDVPDAELESFYSFRLVGAAVVCPGPGGATWGGRGRCSRGSRRGNAPTSNHPTIRDGCGP